MKKKLSVVKSQQKIAGVTPTVGLQQPATHKLLSQSKQKKISSGACLTNIRNKQNDLQPPKLQTDARQPEKADKQPTMAPTTKLIRERFERSIKERLDENRLRGQSKKIQPSTDKYVSNTPKYNSTVNHRDLSYRKQFLFPHSIHNNNNQKPSSGTTRGKRFSSIRRSEAQVTISGNEQSRYGVKDRDKSTNKNEKKQSVWGKRELVLTSERDKKPLKESNSVAPSTTKQKGTSLTKFLTQLPAPKTILTVSSYSNLFSANNPQIPTNYYYISTLIEAFSDRTNNTSFMQLTRNHLFMTLQVFNITRNIERPLSNTVANDTNQSKPITRVRNTLVFDLDETLIHCNQSTEVPYDVLMNINFPNGDSTKAGINVRPHAQETLRELAEHFDIIIFTASHECYANVVIDYLDPTKTLVKSRYFRDSCYRTQQGLYIKDLRVIGRPLQKIILIDNAAYSYAFQLDNGVPIIPFYDDKTDIELKRLCSYLKPFSNCKDIRKENSRYFKTRHYMNFTDPTELIRTLYSSYLQCQQ